MRQCPFHHPPVSAQFLARLDAPPSYPRRYAPLSQCLAASREVVSLVCMQLFGALAWASTRPLDGLDGIHGLLEDLGVVDVGSRVDHRERDSSPVEHNMALRALLSFIRRIRSGLLTPPGPGTLAESNDALCPSISSALPNRSKSSRCSFSHTPASCHSLRRRQQVMPDPHPISWGSISQGIPLFKTNKMPLSAARSSMRGLPPLGLGGSSGNSGSTTSHNSSVTSSLAMLSSYPPPGFVRLTKTKACSIGVPEHRSLKYSFMNSAES